MQKTVELSLVQHIERIVEVTVVITQHNTKPAAVAVHRQVVEIKMKSSTFLGDTDSVDQQENPAEASQTLGPFEVGPPLWNQLPLGMGGDDQLHPAPQGKLRSRTSFEMTLDRARQVSLTMRADGIN